MENNRGINDLPPAMIQEILLRLPVKSLSLSRRVCKMWLHLISDPNFAKSHFELAAEPTRRCLFIQGTNALLYDLDALFNDDYSPVKLSLPCKNPSTVDVLQSCRGFVLLDQYPQLIIWNPLTGARKQISYSHVVPNVKWLKHVVGSRRVCGFGYDASKDDYMVIVAWRDRNKEHHFDFFSVRNNSWKNFEVALPNPLLANVWRCGLFLNGAFHWVAQPSYHNEPIAILVFNLMERSFSEIPLPEPLVENWPPHLVKDGPPQLVELGGCLALYYWSDDENILKIWVMKDYKVQSSWTSYGIRGIDFQPISLSSGGNIIGFDDDSGRFSKYNFSGEQLKYSSYRRFLEYRYTVFTESLMSLPNGS